MAICAIPDASGVLSVVEVQSLELCTGFLLVTPDDKIAFLERIFDPSFLSPENYQVLFNLGFTAPILSYLVAWAYNSVIMFIEDYRT